ncbi:MAG: hypothetical protein Q9209_004699 [Squamulea sp. 1 TL-2023]
MAGNVSSFHTSAVNFDTASILENISSTVIKSNSNSPKPDEEKQKQKPSAYASLSPYRSMFSNEMVTIEVGPRKVPFLIHKGLICSESKFFNAAFNGQFKEATTQSVHLDEEDPGDFDIIHKYLYTEKLTIAHNGKDELLGRGSKCLDIYVLSDKLDIPNVCDAAINHINVVINSLQTIQSGFILSAYARTASKSKLRQFIISVLAQNIHYNIDEITFHNPWAFRSHTLRFILQGIDRNPHINLVNHELQNFAISNLALIKPTMKFLITITAFAALLPITLAVSSAADSEDVVPLTDSAPTEANPSTANETIAIAGVDYDDTTLNEAAASHENHLAERKVTRNSDLVISAYRNKGCSGPRVDVKVRYDSAYDYPVKSYTTSRRLKMGEVISLYGKVGKNRCGQETSHTPPVMKKGCHGLGGGSVGGASCFKANAIFLAEEES